MAIVRTFALGLSLCMMANKEPARADTQDELNALKLAFPLTSVKRPADETFEDVNERIAKLYGKWFEVTRIGNGLNLPETDMFERFCSDFSREILPAGDLGLEVVQRTNQGEIRVNYLFVGGWTFAAFPDQESFRTTFFENSEIGNISAETMMWRSSVMSFADDFELIPSGDNLILESMPRAGFRVWVRCPDAG